MTSELPEETLRILYAFSVSTLNLEHPLPMHTGMTDNILASSLWLPNAALKHQLKVDPGRRYFSEQGWGRFWRPGIRHHHRPGDSTGHLERGEVSD